MHIGRGLGLVVVFLSVNIAAEVLTELMLLLTRSGWGLVFMALAALLVGALAGSLFAYRYWHATEYDLRRVHRTPLYCVLLLAVVLLLSSFLLPVAG